MIQSTRPLFGAFQSSSVAVGVPTRPIITINALRCLSGTRWHSGATCRSSKGFGESSTSNEPAKAEISDGASPVETLEAQIRARKSKKGGGKIEPKVKVVSPVVDAVTGKTEATPEGQAETGVVLALFYFFLLILVEGLLLAGSGFLPEDWDQWIQDKIYPGYSGTVLLFLGFSSMYGLFKTGKLPGQKQQQ